MKYMFCFGLGFSARTLAGKLARAGWKIGATSRSEAGASAIRALGYEAHVCNANSPLSAPAFAGVTHILSSVPPDSDGDPVLRLHRADLATLANQVEWAGYLSTTGVYGDHGGGLVTEDTPLTPNTERGNRRKAAEGDWLTLWEAYGLPVHIFRLAGIYGPGRNQLESLRDGTAKRIIKAGQVFSRIHVEDIANVLEASIARPHPGRAYNVCDDEPAPPQDVVEYGARLLGLPVPADIPFEAADLSPMARSFYADSKCVSNDRIKAELGVKLRFPTYREGLEALATDFIS
jgi:nucleoside-diphosphate-sugar epimerase